ncbi:MAG: tetratricopeptide repeat protein, partial [Planctomycetota bacterium]
SGDVDGETVRAIRGDLDRIVLKAVAWDPELRYDSAAALADDLDRFIRGEAVLASGPSPVYVARKFVSRHVAASVLALVAVLALMAGLGAAVLGLGEALRQREEARENGARAALVGETLLRTIAESADPDVRGKPSPLSVQDLSNLAEQALEAAQRDPEAMLPVVEQIARLQTKLENSPGAVETLGAAIRIAESHYGTPHERVISLLVRQYDIQSSAGIHGRRETIDHAMAQARELWPEDRPEFLRVLQRTPISLAEMEALAARYEREGIASPSDEMSLVARMMMAHRFGPTPDKQIGLSRRLLELSVAEDGPNASYSIMALGTLGDCLVVYERDRSGVPMLEEADERATSVLGEAHWLTGTIRRNRAMAYGLIVEPERGIPILEHLIDNVPPSSLGEVSQTNTRNSYGGLLMQAGRHDDAIRVLTEVLSTRRTQWSAGNRNIVQTLMDLSAALLALGRAEEALPMTEEALRHSDPAMRASQYARAATLRMINLREVGRSGEAEELLEQAGGRLRIAGAADDLIAGLGLDGLSR